MHAVGHGFGEGIAQKLERYVYLFGISRAVENFAADVPNDTSTAAFAKLMQVEYERYVRLVKEMGLTAK